MFKLVICDDEGKTTVVPLIRDEISIGRREGNTIRLTDRNVSRNHARLIRQDDGFLIEDVGSYCGTKVNGQTLKSQSEMISPKDQITIGDYSVSIRTDVADDVPLGKQMLDGDGAGIGKVTAHSRLVLLSPPEPGREIDLTADLYVIGRSEDSNCRINHPSLSRAHARIDLDGTQWTISDLDSISGIQINGIKKDDYVLKPGDIIELSKVKLRYVAPGEPYEYTPAEDKTDSPVVQAKPRKLLPLLLGVAVVALAAIVAAFVMFGKSDGDSLDEDTSEDMANQNLSYEELIERGKDKMQAQKWGDAANLFLLASQKNPDSKIAKEYKNAAIAESDAHQISKSAAASEEAGEFEKALSQYSSISRTSRYYKSEDIARITSKHCNDLLKKSADDLSLGNLAKAGHKLDAIEQLSDAPQECLSRKDELRKQIRSKVVQNPSSEHSATHRSSNSGAGNDGSIGISNPYESKTSPLKSAREAWDRGDKKGAIRILEKAGNSKDILATLAKLYSKTGNRNGYERVADKYIRLYPNDPKTAQFKKYLGR